MTESAGDNSTWTLLSNHGAALMFVAEHPDATIYEIGEAIGVRERAAARIVRDLREAGYLTAERVGRRNTYEVELSIPLRHEVGRQHRAADLLSGLIDTERWTSRGRRPGTSRRVRSRPPSRS